MDFESVRITARPGDATGVGVTNAEFDAAGLVAHAPTHHMQDSTIIHDKVMVTVPLIATTPDTVVFLVNEGRWQVASVTEVHTVVGSTNAAVDIMACSGTTAPESGTTQLGAAIDLTATINVVQNPALISSPTVLGPGDRLALDMDGTLTGLVGLLMIMMKRVG